MFDLYVLVDNERREILTPINKIPEDWSNINGLNLFDDEKLKNLDWAGHTNLGWVSYVNSLISDYSVSDNWLDSSKSNIKLLVSKQRKEKTEETLVFRGNRINLTENTKSSLTLRASSLANQDSVTAWKFVDGYVSLSKQDVIDLLNFVSNYIQQCFDVENNFTNTVNSCTNFSDIKNLSFDIIWPNTESP